MKQHTSPIMIKDKTILTLEKVSLNSKEYDEDWIQDICYRSPNLLPVAKIIAKKERGEDTTAEEQQIDLMVYNLYELTYDEVKIVDPEFGLTEEEYMNYEL